MTPLESIESVLRIGVNEVRLLWSRLIVERDLVNEVRLSGVDEEWF
jgi:hypothetical protein